MKTITLSFVIILLFSFAAFSQSENNDEIKTIFGKIDSHGGYLGFDISVSEIDGENAMFIGGKGAWVIGHGFSVGLAGGGFFNDYHFNEKLGENVNLEGGYGGLLLEPIILPKFPVHISMPVLLGLGGVSYTSDYYNTMDDEWSNFIEAGDAFLIVEPGVQIEMNLVRSVRVCVGASYRYTSELDLDYQYTGVNNDVLDGLSFGASIKFGKF
ncbi:MAG: hypothetical protein C0594_00025 [Marinilabiliales bacterium]|nr:MAG: hypothetical protein C0594_00025 [Marinilabiliales bacterium]